MTRRFNHMMFFLHEMVIAWAAIMLIALAPAASAQTTRPSLSLVYAHEAFPLGTDPAMRNIHSVYEPGKPAFWKRYIEGTANRYAAAGLRGLIAHNLMGSAPGNRYIIDGWQEAPKWLKADFVEEWRKFHRQHPTFEVIAYVGAESIDTTKPLTVERVRAGLKPFVDAGMSIAIDASAEFGEYDLRLQVMRELWADGVPVYSEAFATANRPWMAEFHQMATPFVWQDMQVNPSVYVPREKTTGRLIVWVPNEFGSAQKHAGLYRELITHGVFPTGPVRYLWEIGSSPSEIER